MVTQQGAPKARSGTGTITTSTINRLSNPRTDLPSPPILDRRSSLPPLGGGSGGQDFTGDDHECTGDHEELDSHITLMDSMDLDSVSSTTDDPSPRTRTRRLCQAPGSKCSHSMPRRHTGGQRGQLDFGLPKVIDDATSIMGKIHDREVIEVKRNRDYHPQRVGSAQSGRSIESRSSTSNSIREEEEEEAEEEERRRRNGGEKMGRQMSASGARPEVYKGMSEEVGRKGPISELQTSPRRRQRLAQSVESLGFDRKDGEGEDGEQVGITMSAWRRRRMENQPAGSKKSSLEYSKEEKDAETAALEEISKGKEKMATNGSDTAPAAATSNGAPVRPGPRRTGGSLGGSGTIRAPGTLMNGSSNGFERGGKGSVIPVRDSNIGIQSGGSSGSGAGASKTRKAADEKEGTRNRSPTITQQRASPPLGRPASGLSLRSGLPRPSNSGPNTPIKTSKSSIPSPAPPIRAKTGLPSPSTRHERTKSSAPSSSALHRSHSSTSATSATSSTSANANAAAAAATTTSASTTSRFQGSSTIRSREPPKLRGFAGSAAQPSTVHEASKEDISRMPESPLPFGMTKSSSSSGQSSSRPSSSHSAIYSPTSATADKGSRQEEEHHHIVEHLETLRDEQKPRERRREERKKKEDERKDAEREEAKLKDIIASIDSLGKDQEIRSPSRLSRTKSLDSLVPNRASLDAEKKTPSRPRSAGRDSEMDLETPLKLFSPTSEMGDFTARLLRSPAVEDYEDLLNLVDSDKEEEEQQRNSKNVREKQSQREPISPPMSPESLNSPIAEKHSGTVEEPQETTKPGKLRRAIIKTAIIKKTVRPKSLVIPKRSILEEDSDDSLDHLIKHDQDFSALLKPGSSDDEDDIDSIEVLVASKPYNPQETKDQPPRSVSDATTGDRQSEAERAVHEKLMNRFKTLQLEVRSVARGIEVLEQWLSPGGETISSGSSSDIISEISEQEEILYRLRCDEERQRLRLQTKVLEDALKRRDICLANAPEFSRVPVVLKDPPPVGTKPTRAIVFTAIWLFRHAWTAIHSIGHALWLLTEYISAIPDMITELWAAHFGAAPEVEEIVQETVETIVEMAAEEIVWGAEFVW
ncbi:uncharacterized protein LAJ45_09455 [Morchella importuna]|uniref:uncharacterized protein n=1 Tax=Morchella importuna TaxID=1174673 RepID=UPI001E8DBF0E|nr:uncharacterized protein LAJ45_09455 [Morchella importuna]KAH8146509.1 hypothetical protein LAJ45_09455 [Morchella importuna]